MSLYLIDYENVREKGFEGVEKLTGRDEVIIFTVNSLRICHSRFMWN